MVCKDIVQKGINFYINVLNHRKILVFDGESANITGSNIGNKYLYENFDEFEENDVDHKWHDGAILIKGSVATVLNKHFTFKWKVRGGDIRGTLGKGKGTEVMYVWCTVIFPE